MSLIISSHVWVLPVPISHVLGHLGVQVTPLLVHSQYSVASHARHFLLQPYLSAVVVVVVAEEQLNDVTPSSCSVQLQYWVLSHATSHFSWHDLAATVTVMRVANKTSKTAMRPIFSYKWPTHEVVNRNKSLNLKTVTDSLVYA